MQTISFLVVLVIGACFFQVTVAQEAQSGDNPINDFINAAQETINKIIANIEEDASKAESTLQGLIHQVINNASSTVSSLSPQLQGIAVKALGDIKALARLNTGDISTCLKAAEDGLTQVASKFAESEKNCFATEINTAQSIVTTVVSTVNTTVTTVQTLPDQLKNCGTNPLCITNIVKQVAQVGSNAAATITEQVAKATTFVSGLQARLETCATTQVVNLETSAGQIGVSFVNCATGKSS